MPDREFKIKITTPADTSGADETGKALDKGGESAEKFNTKGREMHKVMHELNHIMPGLGALMKAVFDPEKIGMIAFLVIVQQVVKALEHMKQVHEAHAAASIARWQAEQQAANDAKQAADDYAKALGDIAKSVDTLKEKEVSELATLNAILEARKKILDAQEAAEMAAAKDNPIAQAEIQARYKKKKSDEELTAEAAQIEQKKQNLEREKAAERAAQDASDAAERAKEKGAPGVDAAADAATRAHDNEERTKKAQLARDAAKEDVEHGLFPGSRIGEPPMMGKARENTLAAAEKELAAAKEKEEADRQIVEQRKQAQKKLDDAVTEALAREKEASARREATEADVRTSQDVYNIHKQTAAAINETERKSELQQAGFKPDAPLGKSLQGDISAAEAQAHGEKLTTAQNAALQQLYAALVQQTGSQAEAQKLFKLMHDLHVDHKTKLIELATALNQLKQVVRAGNTP